MSLINLIKKGESNTLEFKETFRYNTETNQKDRRLKNEVSKAVCGMLNSDGGIILIGVADDKSIMGIERDLRLYGIGNESNRIDKLKIDLNDHITNTIGIKSKKFLKTKIIEIDGEKIIKIEINPSNDPFFHSEDEIYYVRDGPSTIKLSKRKMGEYISDRSKSSFLKSPKELRQIKLDNISNEFQNWVRKKLENILVLKINIDSQDGLIYDYIFGCIVPDSLSDDLINFNSDLIKEYIIDYSIIKTSQTYKTPELARQYEPNIGEDILIHPNGIIYFCLNYNYINPEKPEFSLGYLESRPSEILNVKKHQEKYNAPFSTITWGKLESLLEVVCFIFHPECKKNIIRIPTESFSLELIVPNMIFNGKRRILSRSGGFPSHKKYLGDKKDIIIREFFEYNKIPEFVDSIKTKITDFYQNPADKGYRYI